MTIRFGILALVLAFCARTPALAWSAEGHKAVGEIAAGRLNATAKAAVARILGNSDLAAVAVWADDVRAAASHRGPLVSDAEARAFNQKFPKNPGWHFVNLPLATDRYTDDGAFSSRDDVVHAINRCVAVLEAKSDEFTEAQALKLLVHFVGDVHQPLHASTGYFDLSNPSAPKLITDPAVVDPRTGDRAGNSLYFTKSGELHALWDNTLVKKSGADYVTVAAVVKKRIKSAAWKNTGDYHAWAEQWATDSVHVAKLVYQGIVFGPATLNAKHELERDEIKLPGDYQAANEPRAADQLAKAGFHLAELLNSIRWAQRP